MNRPSLPGEQAIRRGIADLALGRESVESLLVSVGYPRLEQSGLRLPPRRFDRPEHSLFALLSRQSTGSAHSRYNALVRMLVSYERARSCAS